MRIAIAHPRRGPLLSTALQALCITKIARAHGDQALLMQGMAAHTQALRALQNATNDRNTALTDETMAAIRVLGTYELHEGTMGSVIGWKSHEEGVDQLVQLRGFNSSQYESELGQALFGEVRRSAVSELLFVSVLTPRCQISCRQLMLTRTVDDPTSSILQRFLL